MGLTPFCVYNIQYIFSIVNSVCVDCILYCVFT